jgi:hypothetical protein
MMKSGPITSEHADDYVDRIAGMPAQLTPIAGHDCREKYRRKRQSGGTRG